MPMVMDPRIEALYLKYQSQLLTSGCPTPLAYLEALTALLRQRAQENPGFEDFPYSPTPGDGRLLQVALIPGRINYYKYQERFGFIGWDGKPDSWFSRDHVADPALRGMLDNRDLYISGTLISFRSGGITRDGEKRPTAVNIWLRRFTMEDRTHGDMWERDLIDGIAITRRGNTRTGVCSGYV